MRNPPGTDPWIELELTGLDAAFRIDVDADGTWDHTYITTVDTFQAGLCGLTCYRDVRFDGFCCGPAPGHWDIGAFCESFDGYDVTGIDGWTERVGDWSTVDDRLRPEGTADWHYVTKDGSYQADGVVEAKVLYSLGTGLKFGGVVARYLSEDHYLMFKVQDGGLGYFNAAFLYDSGTLLASYADYDFGTEPVVRLACVGTIVIADVDVEGDGEWDHSFTATTSTTDHGFAGVTAYSQVELDDFCFGDDYLSYGNANSVATFDGVPQSYWRYGGGQNLGAHYPGLEFGPSATIMEASVYGYFEVGYPYHSFDAVLSSGQDVLRVDITPPTDHVGLWYTYGNSEGGGLIVRGYDAADTMVASATGHYNSSYNDYLQLNAPGMAYVLIEGPDNYYTIDDFEWNYDGVPETLDAALSVSPASGVVPFPAQFTVQLDNLYAEQTRRFAAHIDVTTAAGNTFPNWRAGATNVSGGGAFSSSWVTTIPALGSLIGDNTFQLVAEDVTPAPYNQPPYPPAGDTATGLAVVTGIAP